MSDIKSRLDYITYDDKSKELNKIFHEEFKNLIQKIEDNLENSKEKSLALTKLEESWMWVGKSIKISQEIREKNERN